MVEGRGDGFRREILKAVYEFVSGLSINKEKGVVDAANCTSVAVTNVIMEDVAKEGWVLDGRGVARFFVDGCSLPP